MKQNDSWLDELLEQVAGGRMLPAEALQQFFLHKREEADPTLTEEDNAFISAMDAVEVAHTVAKWCARNAAAQGGVAALTVDLRRPGFFHPNRRPPLVTGLALSGTRLMLFSPADPQQGGEYAEDCLRVAGSFSGAQGDPAFLPVFTSALNTALKGHGLPRPEYLS